MYICSNNTVIRNIGKGSLIMTIKQCSCKWRQKQIQNVLYALMCVAKYKFIQTGTKETSGQLLAIAFSDCLMPNRESNSSLVSLLNAEEHVWRKEAIRKYLDFLDSGTKDWRIVDFTSSPTHFLCSSVRQTCELVNKDSGSVSPSALILISSYHCPANWIFLAVFILVSIEHASPSKIRSGDAANQLSDVSTNILHSDSVALVSALKHAAAASS